MRRKAKVVQPADTTVTEAQLGLLALVEQGGVHRGATRWYLRHRPAVRSDADDLEVLELRRWIAWERPQRAAEHGMAAPVDITPRGRAALQYHLPGWVLGRTAIQ
ncbi:hypothetical protein SAMN05216553_1257 [Lentzea fradiae]|uniref:Uncharacterized protein n=1 Tax=Lentzea fradiae TaxID=200378 RepID=A0A1G8CX44_9PSEU|nr:hypothetical protein [Lentzea fradiae]SDH50012.1 hypothetical protein SAMN05216553_1257 [Lentzea fradiae]